GPQSKHAGLQSKLHSPVSRHATWCLLVVNGGNLRSAALAAELAQFGARKRIHAVLPVEGGADDGGSGEISSATRRILRFDSSIKSGCAPLFRLACRVTSPLSYFSRCSRPAANAASSTFLSMSHDFAVSSTSLTKLNQLAMSAELGGAMP